MSSSQSTLLIITAMACFLNSSAMPTKTLPTRAPTPAVKTHYTEGEDITLDCDAEGTLAPVFHWLHNGNYVEQSPLDINARNLISSSIHHTQTSTVTTIVIPNAKVENSGKYTCIADSLTKRVVRSFTITVTRPEGQKPSEQTSQDSLRIYQHTNSILQDGSSPIYAICRATQGITSPTPVVRWSVDGQQLEESDEIKVHTNGDLEMSAEALRNLGTWFFDLECTAYSQDGLRTVNAMAFVYLSDDNTETSSES